MQRDGSLASRYPPGTCGTCQGITLEFLWDLSRTLDGSKNLVFPNLSSTSKSRPLCAMLADVIGSSSNRPDPSTIAVRAREERMWASQRLQETLQARSIAFCADQASFASRPLRKAPAPVKQSQKSKDQVTAWLSHCVTKHSQCSLTLSQELVQTETELPTRLVQADLHDSLSPRLAITRGERGQSLTPSHC